VIRGLHGAAFTFTTLFRPTISGVTPLAQEKSFRSSPPAQQDQEPRPATFWLAAMPGSSFTGKIVKKGDPKTAAPIGWIWFGAVDPQLSHGPPLVQD
jgi:hypothetical protein